MIMEYDRHLKEGGGVDDWMDGWMDGWSSN